MRSILDAVRQAARKKVLFLPQAIKQLARPAIMISTGEVDHVVAEVCSPKDEYLAIITTYVPDGSQWPPDVQRTMPAKVVAPRRVRCGMVAATGADAVMTAPAGETGSVPVANRARDWFNQACHDLDQAQDSRLAGRHDWACFAAEQAAEKAVKALHLHLGQEAWGHVVAKLLVELPEAVSVPKDLVEQGRVLDNFYIPARYPNSHPEGAPFEHYGPLQSEEAIGHARAIVEFVRSQMA